MRAKILAKAEKLTVLAGRYCDLDRAARWRKPALMLGTAGWAARWGIFGYMTYDLVTAAQAAEMATLPGSGVQKSAAYAVAIGACMLVKWAGWAYGGIGYVHHRKMLAAAKISV